MMHYQRFMKHGDPLFTKTAPTGEPLRFLESVLELETDDCITWPYAKSGAGYGQIRSNGETKYVHRIVCESVHGPQPSKECEVAHTCGKGHEGCVNKRHVKWCSPKTNQSHRVIHGTSNRGEQHGLSKLKSSDVLSIREDERQFEEIANQYGVHATTVKNIKNRESWSWLK